MDMHDGVSKLWIVRAARGLDVDGCKDEIEAIDKLIRHALTFDGWFEPEDLKARIRDAVESALKHNDKDYESTGPVSEEDPS